MSSEMYVRHRGDWEWCQAILTAGSMLGFERGGQPVDEHAQRHGFPRSARVDGVNREDAGSAIGENFLEPAAGQIGSCHRIPDLNDATMLETVVQQQVHVVEGDGLRHRMPRVAAAKLERELPRAAGTVLCGVSRAMPRQVFYLGRTSMPRQIEPACHGDQAVAPYPAAETVGILEFAQPDR